MEDRLPPPVARSSDALKWTYTQVRRLAPFAWMFGILASLCWIFFSGLASLLEKIGREADGMKPYTQEKSGVLVDLARFVREIGPYAGLAAVVCSLVALFFEAAKVFFGSSRSLVEARIGGDSATKPADPPSPPSPPSPPDEPVTKQAAG